MRTADKIIILMLISLSLGAFYFQYLSDELNKRMDRIIYEDQRLTDKVEDEFTDSLRQYNLRFIGRGKHLRKAQIDIVLNKELIVRNTDSLSTIIDDVDFKLDNFIRDTENSFKTVKNDLEDLSDEVRSNIRRTKQKISDLEQSLSKINDNIKNIESLPTYIKEDAKKKAAEQE